MNVPSPIRWLIDKYNDWRYPVRPVCPIPACILGDHKGDTHQDSHGIKFNLGRILDDNWSDSSDQLFDRPSPFSMGESFEP